jgi:hypothetical protein
MPAVSNMRGWLKETGREWRQTTPTQSPARQSARIHPDGDLIFSSATYAMPVLKLRFDREGVDESVRQPMWRTGQCYELATKLVDQLFPMTRLGID